MAESGIGPAGAGALFSGLVGHWRLDRQIADRVGGGSGHLTGRAEFAPGTGPEELVYLEEGTLRLGSGPALRATRRYLWRREGALVAVDFGDGRPFHRFDAAAALPAARHDCAPDLYRVTYDFSAWPCWRSHWAVTGPRKDYTMISDYRPASAPGAAAPA